jgi:hypothetical protein
MKLIRFGVQGKRKITNLQIWEVRWRPASETPPAVVYKYPPKPPILPKTNGLPQTTTKPRRMSEEETWSEDNYHDLCTEDGTFIPKGNLPTSSMSHHVMLPDPRPALDVDDLYQLEFKIAEKKLQFLNKRRALQLSHSGVEVQPSVALSANLVGGL